jgi:oxygen-dependent protoporphyrinogen oxidase
MRPIAIAATGDERQTPAHIVIVGGGIAGLATAHYLRKSASPEAVHRGLTVTVLEQSARPGGKIITEQIDGYGDEPFVVEGGPDSFLTQKPWALQLARELGLSDRLLGTNDDRRKTFVLNRGKPEPLPDGVMLIVPTRFLPFAFSPLLSPWGKLRMGMDIVIPARRDDEDETLADFVRRRLGDEALDKIAEPLLAGIYNAEAERQSLLATFPRFREIEKKYGSLIRGMLAARQARPAGAAPQPKPPPMFMTLHGGTQELVDALARELGDSVRLHSAVRFLERLPEQGRYRLVVEQGSRVSTLEADAVILAIPSYGAAELLRDVTPDGATRLQAMRTVSTGTLSLAYRRNEVTHPLDGFGIVIPRSERRLINAISWSSTKFDHRAPAGYALLRVFFGGSRNPQMMERGDEEIVEIARRELAQIMGLVAEPIFHRIYRWPNANPQYDVGHLARVDAIEAALPKGIYVTGSPYRGIGIPDCVHQAQQTAEKALKQLAAEQVIV